MASGELTPEHIFFFAKTAQKADKRPPFNQSIFQKLKILESFGLDRPAGFFSLLSAANT